MSNTVAARQYLLLMRHAAHRRGHLTDDGKAQVGGLAERLAEWIHAEWRDESDRSVRLWYTSESTEVRETVDLLAREVVTEMARRNTPANYPFVDSESKKVPVSGPQTINLRHPWMPAPVPTPPAPTGTDFAQALSAYSPDRTAFDGLYSWLNAAKPEEQPARRSDLDVPLLVGNDPLIGWLATRLSGRATPVARGELICLTRDRNAKRRFAWLCRGPRDSRWRLLWTISGDDEVASEAIRAKIKSKMTTATALGTVIVGLTTFLLQNALQKEPSLWQWFAFAALAASAALYFATLFLYDTLQMPTRFWASHFPQTSRTPTRAESVWARARHGRPSIRRPPSSTARVLQTSMVRIWSWVFTPATILAAVGVLLYALGATSTARDDVAKVQLWHVLVAIPALVALVGAWLAWHRPSLGTSD